VQKNRVAHLAQIDEAEKQEREGELERYQRLSEMCKQLQDRLEQDSFAHEQDRRSWEMTDRAKDARIIELERESARQRAEVADLQRLLRSKVPPDISRTTTFANTPTLVNHLANTPAEIRVKRAGEEAAAASHLATKLLANLRDLKSDFRMSQAETFHQEALHSGMPGVRSVNFYESHGQRALHR
jgi:hypothetical protein